MDTQKSHRKETIMRLALFVYCCCLLVSKTVDAVYPPNFHNQSGCLYAYIDDGRYHITFPEAESQKGGLTKLQYDKETNCTQGMYPGNLVITYHVNEDYMDSMQLQFLIKPSPNEGYWQVSSAVLTIVKPTNQHLYPSTTIELKPVDIYAGQSFSYSCNSLVLQNLRTTKDGPSFKITLNRFQLQPFGELQKVVFAPSYDCSVWITLPVLMGMALILFIIFTVMIGVYLLLEQGNQNGDLKFSKQGEMLMNQAQLDAIKG